VKLLPCLLVAALASPAAATTSKHDLAHVRASSFAKEMFPRWLLATGVAVPGEYQDRACPRSVYEILRTVDADACEDETIDPWGHRYEVLCVRSAPQPFIGVYSVGEDGIAGTTDDIRSWNRRR